MYQYKHANKTGCCLSRGPLIAMKHLINSLSVFGIELLESAGYKRTNINNLQNGYFPSMF